MPAQRFGEPRLYNPRLKDEWNHALNRSVDAKNAINARWEKKGDTGVLSPNYEGNTTETKTKAKTNKKTLRCATRTEAGSATDVASSAATPVSLNPSPSEAGRRATQTAHLTVLMEDQSVRHTEFC